MLPRSSASLKTAHFVALGLSHYKWNPYIITNTFVSPHPNVSHEGMQDLVPCGVVSEDEGIWKEGMEIDEVGRREDGATHGTGNLRTMDYYFFRYQWELGTYLGI